MYLQNRDSGGTIYWEQWLVEQLEYIHIYKLSSQYYVESLQPSKIITKKYYWSQSPHHIHAIKNDYQNVKGIVSTNFYNNSTYKLAQWTAAINFPFMLSAMSARNNKLGHKK